MARLEPPWRKRSKSASSLKSQAQLRDFAGVFLTVAALGWLLASTVPADGPRVLPHSTSLTNSFFQQTRVEHLLGARHCTRHQDIMVDQPMWSLLPGYSPVGKTDGNQIIRE